MFIIIELTIFFNSSLLKQGHQFKCSEYEETEYIFLTYSSAAKKAISKIYNYVAK